MKNKSILLSLAVGVLSAAPAFADKLPHTAIEQTTNSFSFHQHPNESPLQGTVSMLNFGRSTFNDVMNGSPLIGFDEDGKTLAAKGPLSLQPGKNDSEGHLIDLGLTVGDAFGKGGAKDLGKHNPKDVGAGGSAAPVVTVPEPGSFTLMLFGLGALGVLRNRRYKL